jgi:hypothetical protein
MPMDDSAGAGRDPELMPNPDVAGPDVVGDADADADRRELRAEIGKYVSLASFPTRARELIAAAESNGAPDQVLDQLRTLDAGEEFSTARDVWLALGLEATDRF